jgi:photosystem II stability/assembly factor-like uncharacterized protein
MKKMLVLVFMIAPAFAAAQSGKTLKRTFRLSGESGVLTSAPRPSGNTVSVVRTVADTAYTANERGLSITTDGGASWINVGRADGIYKGSIAAIDVSGPTIYVSTIFDTSITPKPTAGAGGGLSISTDFGVSWRHIPQPMDTFTTHYGYFLRPNGDTLTITSVRTNIDNVTYDIAVTDSTIWLTSFAGGTRVARILSDGTIAPFELTGIPPDTLDEVLPNQDYDFLIDPFLNLNHRAFSVIAATDGIWAGTAAGINRSTDAGLSWTRYSVANSNLPGNFVVALGEQIYVENGQLYRNMWAACNQALGQNEYNGIAVSADSGRTWRVVLRGPFMNNIAFDGKTVYVASDDGLYRSGDLGTTWERFLTLVDRNTQDRTYSPAFLSVGLDSTSNPARVYAGNVDVLAVSDDNGVSWRFARSFIDPGTNGTPRSYAAPNPFSPSFLPNVTRFFFDSTGLDPAADKVTIRIYDFAMDLVATVAEDESLTKQFAWNGLNNRGKRVANGTYVYTIKAGGRTFWGKVTVRN